MIKKALKRTLFFLTIIIMIFSVFFQLFSFYDKSYLFLEEFNNNVLCGEYTQAYDVNKADNYIDKNADFSFKPKDGTVINNKYKYISAEIEKFINDNKLSIGFSLTNTSNNNVKYGIFKIEYENAYPLYIYSESEDKKYDGEYKTKLVIKRNISGKLLFTEIHIEYE